ncbi:uncharacterized protein with PQ loop repeat [Nocardioides luteus]|uniref:DUF4064 domain-containing protein n=1 Tax=Nocardioides luteus TaxID=1844 RepID=A0ABQ5SZ04_9ACTN|nr:hypothetical protein [Nocardioides luteus]MDR7312439.1 uncharacterized protein with PQ loop repeat [Nocardioides luteus]GGR58483.1 hypothetical protein GCM10010197_26650 [Nocardioides luteus]GLJ68687.1 hypothetical protein GCM10017579_27230 [Nocardioides luteus]
MSDQYGSFDNPYGGKPPFQGQEPPPPTPYASPQQPTPQQPAPQQPAQPQGWGQQPQGYGQVPPAYGQVPPAYGQYAMGQQPPAYRPYYPPPDPDARPGTVTAASVMTIVGSVTALLITLFMVPAGISDYNDPTSSDKDVTLVMVIWFIVCGVLSLISTVLGIWVLFRSRPARILLTVVGSLAALLSLITIVYPALIIAALVMLYAGRAGHWFAHRTPGDPLQPQSVPGAPPVGPTPPAGPTPPTHHQL